jgi:RimJ/RimL family protein N-acetyltransferase
MRAYVCDSVSMLESVAMATQLFNPKPINLQGRTVRLEPLGAEHAAGLLDAGRDAALWKWMPRGPFVDESDVRTWIGQAQSCEQSVSFAILKMEAGQPNQVVGSTRFLDIQPENFGLEIGWTWLSPAAQRSPINTECKWLLLSHAFDGLQATRVQLKTDSLNEQSQRAMERIGAEREGVLRKHRRIELPDGSVRWRDSVYYSIIRDEWPAVKTHLDRLLAREY